MKKCFIFLLIVFFKKHVGKSIFKKMGKKNRERLKNLVNLQ